MENKTIQSFRSRIDTIDKQLVELLAERLELAYEIGREKGKAGHPVTVPDREEEIYRSLENIKHRFFSPDELKNIFSLIISLGRKAGIKGFRDVTEEMESKT
jgi:chorismate mutase